MDVKDLLRLGIETRSWVKVKKAFSLLTGTKPKNKRRAKPFKVPPQLKKIVEDGNVDAFNQFRMEHSQTVRADGKKSCVVLPHEKPHENLFVDNRKVAKQQIASDKKLNRGRRPKDSRPPPKMVKVVCDKCGAKAKVNAADAPVSIGGEQMGWYCPKCSKRRRS